MMGRRGEYGVFAVDSCLRQQRSHRLQVGMVCLVQGNVEDLAEVDRVRNPELVGTAQLRDRDPVSQGDASE
jgi:hypothetical protein